MNETNRSDRAAQEASIRALFNVEVLRLHGTCAMTIALSVYFLLSQSGNSSSPSNLSGTGRPAKYQAYSLSDFFLSYSYSLKPAVKMNRPHI